MLIFTKAGRLSARDSKTNIPLSFDVPQGVKALKVHYEYNPKMVEDEEAAGRAITEALRKYNVNVVNASSFLPVANLVTLSFDECGAYRGACHRQPNVQDIIITDKDSTPGITNSPIKAGRWQVVLNVHYAGCEIDYSIEIEGEV